MLLTIFEAIVKQSKRALLVIDMLRDFIDPDGALSIGPTLEKAFHFTELLEKLAGAYYAALATGREVTVLPDMIRDGVFMINTSKKDMEIARKESLTAAIVAGCAVAFLGFGFAASFGVFLRPMSE